MGKRGGKRHNRGRGGGRGGGRDNRIGWEDVEKSNKDYEDYYNNDLAIVPESERDAFWTSLRTALPNSFRFTGSKGHALTVQKVLVDRYIPKITSVEYEGEPVPPPTQISWYPDQLAWSMTTGKQVVRKFPPFAFFQKFLVSETSVGNISRQEVVSMIPPLVMDIGPGMTVLDLCAAPGSKSAQLAEMIHGGEEARMRKALRKIADENGRAISPDGAAVAIEAQSADLEDDMVDDGRSTGLLIANEIDWRRAQMLVHQIKRLNSPNFIVTNHDARMFPSIIIKAEPGKPREYLKFDRILADVPCTGDGTTRKNVTVWKDWTRQNALGLYATQVLILVRAIQMLKVGGRVVYSTCSLNVIENEAVVGSAIDRCGGSASVKVIDCSDRLPGLERRPGLTSWPVVDRSGRSWKSWEEAEQFKDEHGEDGFSRIVEGMFPPAAGEAEQLQHCMRVYPHLQDTGGFFITVLEKTAEVRKLRDPASQRSKEEAISTQAASDSAEGFAQESVPADPETIQPVDDPLLALEAALGEPQADGANLATVPDDLKPILPLPTTADDATETNPAKIPLDAISLPENESLPPITSPKRQLDDDDDDEEKPSKRQKQTEETATESQVNPNPNPNLNKKRGAPREEPFKYLDPDHPTLLDIYKFYNISPRFPRDRWMVRNANGDPVKAIYYTSAISRKILTLNEGSGMKFVHSGVKMFVKQDAPRPEVCKWRIQSEGLPILEPWVGEERIVRLYKRDTLYTLLRETFVKVKEDAHTLGEIADRVKEIPMGCCVLRVESSDAEDGFADRMALPLWRSIFSLQLMLPKEDRKAMLLRLFNDDSPLIDHNKEKENRKSNNTTASGPAGDADGEGSVSLEANEDGDAEGDVAVEATAVKDGQDGVVLDAAASNEDVEMS